MLAPEYGGDGKQVGDRCDDVDEPLVAFPGHWAPNGLVVYEGTAFPARYRGGFFVAFHGSWNRAPLPQAGYSVAVVENGRHRKVRVYKFKAKSRYRRHIGHRQPYTRVKITEIVA